MDTGSDATLIHVGVAEVLQLRPYNRQVVRGVHAEERECDIYNVDLRVERGGKVLMRLPDLLVAEVEFADIDEEIRIVLGRSALWGSRFTYDGADMTFTLDPPPPFGS